MERSEALLRFNSTAITWALYAMTKAPEVQIKLREELVAVDTETPSMDELMALPYLDAFVRETLRVHSPVPNTLRIAMKDDMIPVEKPYTDKYGVVHDSIRYKPYVSFCEFNAYPVSQNRISKGSSLLIPIMAINNSEELWGPDSQEFKYVSFRLEA